MQLSGAIWGTIEVRFRSRKQLNLLGKGIIENFEKKLMKLDPKRMFPLNVFPSWIITAKGEKEGGGKKGE